MLAIALPGFASERLIPSLLELLDQILDGHKHAFDLVRKAVSHPDGALHVPLLLIEALRVYLLQHHDALAQCLILRGQVVLLLLNARDGLQGVVDQLRAHERLSLRFLFELIGLFQLLLDLYKFLVQLADLLAQLDRVVGLPGQHLALEGLSFILKLLLYPCDGLLFSFAPDQVEILQQLVDKSWREIVSVLIPELVCKLEGLGGHQLIFDALASEHLVELLFLEDAAVASLVLSVGVWR